MEHSQIINNMYHLHAELLPYTGDENGQQREGAHSTLFETAKWNTTAEGANNILLAPHTETSIDPTPHVDGPFRHIPVIQGIPRQKSCKQKVISENPTDFDMTSLKGEGNDGMYRKSTNNELLVCLTPSETIETRPNPNVNSGVENIPNSSKKRNRCRVNITTLPGWTKNSETMTMSGKGSSKKKHNLKKRWTKRYHDTNTSSDAEASSPGEVLLDSVDALVILKEIEVLKMEHEKLKQQVRLQKRRQKQMRRDIDIIGEILPVPTTEISQNISPGQKNCE